MDKYRINFRRGITNMNIETVKIQGDGWLINGSLSVPNAPRNRHYKIVQDWIAEGNEPDLEFTSADLAQREAAQKLAELAATDKGMARIGEDLIDVLISKGVILIADLPQDTQDKLADRKAKRAAL